MRRWQWRIAVAAMVAGLVVAGRVTAPPASPAPSATLPVYTGRSCDPDGVTRRSPGAIDGPQLHPPVAGLRLDPATSRPGDLPSARAQAVARQVVGSDVDTIATHARLLRVSRPPALHRRRAWVVAVSGVPAGFGYCGAVGSREVVVVLDATTGTPLWRYSYR
jgi:hypothetical protein